MFSVSRTGYQFTPSSQISCCWFPAGTAQECWRNSDVPVYPYKNSCLIIPSCVLHLFTKGSHFFPLKLCLWRKDVEITLRCRCPHVMVLPSPSSSSPWDRAAAVWTWVLPHTEVDAWLISQLKEQLSVFCGKKMVAKWKCLAHMSCWGGHVEQTNKKLTGMLSGWNVRWSAFLFQYGTKDGNPEHRPCLDR